MAPFTSHHRASIEQPAARVAPGSAAAHSPAPAGGGGHDDDAAEQERRREQEERADADANASAYLRAHRTHSSELHGIAYTSVDPLPPPHHAADELPQGGASSAAPAATAKQQPHARATTAAAADLEVDLEGGGKHAPRSGGPRAQAAAAVVVGDPDSTATNTTTGSSSNDNDGRALELLEPVPPGGQLVLNFERVSMWAPASPQKPSVLTRASKAVMSCGRATASPRRQILYDVSGQVRPGEVLALMGPSGSGKTSLLTLLGDRSSMEFEGRVSVNGRAYDKAVRKQVGFVLQDDTLYEDLTVQETLGYAALLRLPRAMSREQKLQRVDTVLQALGLSRSRDTIIGGFFRRGISGGERKRVSIGHELLINPAILMLDEPTSGLDSTTALHLMSLLQDLAAGGRSVATTIHQPSSRLYHKLDKLLLLAEGHIAFYGQANQVLDWFSRFGYSIPFGVSIADFVLDLAMGEAGYSNTGATGGAAVRELYTAFESQYGGSTAAPPNGTTKATRHHAAGKQSGSGGGGPAGAAPAGSAHSLAGFSSSPLKQSDSAYSLGSGRLPSSSGGGGGGGNGTVGSLQLQKSVPEASTTTATGDANNAASSSSSSSSSSSHGGRAPYLEQVRVLLQRTGRVRRFEQMTGQHFFQLFAVAFITGLVWWQRGQAYHGGVQAASDVLGLLFFMLLFPSMRSLFRALFTFPNEFRMILKERPSGMYNLSAYYLARTLADVPAEMLNTVLFVVIAYWFGGLRHDVGAFFGLLFSLILVVLVAESWGLLVGGASMDPKTAQTITTVLILTFLLVGGYYVRSIPVWIAWIKYLSFLYYGYNLLIKTQFSGVTFYECSGGGGACTPVPLARLALPTDPNALAFIDVFVLLGMLVFLRGCIYVVLRYKTKVKQSNMQ